MLGGVVSAIYIMEHLFLIIFWCGGGCHKSEIWASEKIIIVVDHVQFSDLYKRYPKTEHDNKYCFHPGSSPKSIYNNI